MKIYRLIAIGVALLFAAPALADMTPAEQQETLAAHNNERAMYPDVLALQWSPQLAGFAQEWVNELAKNPSNVAELKHRPNTSDNPFKPGEWLGENLSGGWGGFPRSQTGPQAVGLWIAEKQWYHYNQNPSCTPPVNRSCGHFTQVIWKATQFVGCGEASTSTGVTYIACNYYPGGNIRGQLPY